MPHTVRRALRRTTLVTALAAAGVLAAAGSAFAHVTVHPDSYAKGASDGTLTFRVPNEEDNATTTQVQVFFPTDHPVPGVLVSPLPGWTSKVTNSKLKTPIKTDDGTITDAVSEITWTKGAIQPGQYQDFSVAFGQLPDDTDHLTFKALQTYSDGNVVRWIDEAQAGQPEPDHPAPVVTLTAATGTPSATAATPSASPQAQTMKMSSHDNTARAVGFGGLVIGLLGLVVAGVAIARGRANRG
ncbi:MAG: YcnI family protein [Streptomyces sp.]|nr:YcnI family protein [Streptomyces sp.]